MAYQSKGNNKEEGMETMKDFFRECLEQLEDKTGIRQLFFLRSSCESQKEFDKRKNIILDSMVVVSGKFNYIPDHAQKKYILRMMIEDQDYDHLDSRVIYKWLNLHKDKHMYEPKITEEEMIPCPPEKVDEYCNQFYEALSKVGKPVPTVQQLEDGLKQVKKKETGRQKFVVEGLEIWAMSQEEAEKMYKASVK